MRAKKTLCNALWGWQALHDDLPEEQYRQLGLFSIITVPENAYDEPSMLYHLETAELVVYLVDGTSGIHADDVRWIAQLRALPAALLIVVNKTNLMAEAPAADAVAQMQAQFARPVLALNVQDQSAVHEQLLPLVLKTAPALTVPLAAEITSLRWGVVKQLIRESALMSGLVTLENGDTVDVPALLDLQRRLVHQIGHIYGHAPSDDGERLNAATAVQRLVFDALAHLIARFGPLGRSLAAGLISASSTWMVGHSAQARYTGESPLARFHHILHRDEHHDRAQNTS